MIARTQPEGRTPSPWGITGSGEDLVVPGGSVVLCGLWYLIVVRSWLTDEQRQQLQPVLAACPHLTALAGHVRDFAQMMATRDGQRLDRWMTAVDADDLPALHSLTTGLRRDHTAVVAGLTLTWSSGPVEGNVNRIKTIKRQMYGRASLDLLRKRILHAA